MAGKHENDYRSFSYVFPSSFFKQIKEIPHLKVIITLKTFGNTYGKDMGIWVYMLYYLGFFFDYEYSFVVFQSLLEVHIIIPYNIIPYNRATLMELAHNLSDRISLTQF